MSPINAAGGNSKPQTNNSSINKKNTKKAANDKKQNKVKKNKNSLSAKKSQKTAETKKQKSVKGSKDKKELNRSSKGCSQNSTNLPAKSKQKDSTSFSNEAKSINGNKMQKNNSGQSDCLTSFLKEELKKMKNGANEIGGKNGLSDAGKSPQDLIKGENSSEKNESHKDPIIKKEISLYNDSLLHKKGNESSQDPVGGKNP